MYAARRTVADTTRRLVTRAYNQFWNGRQFDTAPRLFAEDGHFVGLFGTPGTGPTSIVDYAERLFQAFPDTRMHLQQLIVQRERAAARIRLSATHRGHLLGIEPTGQSIELDCVALYRVAHGRIVEWEVFGSQDTLIHRLRSATDPSRLQ